MKSRNSRHIKLQGGECLGAGTFGCVLKPHIQCKSNSPIKHTSNNNIISKISTYNTYNTDDLENIYDEINMSEKVYKLDKECKYLCPIINYCNIDVNNVIDRTDIKLKNLDTMDDVDLDYSKEGYEKRCIFNINNNFITINLISVYAGPDLDYFFNNNSVFDKYKSLLCSNIKLIISNLFEGLKVLHHNKITHKDIKLNNICMIIKNNKPVIRYIDFGLSEDINSMKHSYNNINGNGTPAYMAPDFIILNEMKKQNFNTLLYKKNIAQNIINKLFMSLKSNLSTFTNKGLNKTYLDGNMDTFTSEINFNMNSIKKESHYFFTKKDITNIYIFLLNLYKNNELLPYHFTPIIGLNPKFDIFSLGLVLFEIKKLLNIKDILLVNLLKNMLELNSINRYSIDDCMEHYYIEH
jgi:serine/threonine protein kinase